MRKWLEKRRVRNDLLSEIEYHKKMVRKFEKEILEALSWGISGKGDLLQESLEGRIDYHQRKVEEIKNTLRVLVK